jgi:hypothetical protein
LDPPGGGRSHLGDLTMEGQVNGMLLPAEIIGAYLTITQRLKIAGQIG